MSAPVSTASTNGDWSPWQEWGEHIGPSWAGHGADVHRGRLLQGIDGLLMQEPAKQGPYKLSYYTPEDWDRGHAAAADRGSGCKTTASPPI
jgi:hypothetical protein